MRHSRLLATVAAVSVSAICASSAFAQRVVVFGDSLSDSGNINALTGGLAPGSPLNRYSNGLNWADLLYGPNPALGWRFGGPSGNVNGYVNYAVGGAYSGSGNLGGNGLPGMQQEIAAFAGFGGTFKAGDTVTLWGGANNGFLALNTPGQTATGIGTAAFLAAGDEIANVNSVIGLGATRILVFNLPNLGSTPALNGSAATVQAGGLYSDTFNANLSSGLTGVAAANSKVNIIQVPVDALFKAVIANPAAYGFTNVTGFCGFTGGAACAGFAFADGVHPTQAAYALIAQLASEVSNTAPALQQVARLGETGVLANELITNQVFDRMSAFISGTYADKNGPFAEVIGSYTTLDGSNGIPGLTMQLGGVRAGIDKKNGATLFGGSLTILEGAVSTGSLKSDLSTFRGDLYGTALFGNTYVSADAGFSRLNYTGLKRQTSFATVATSGSTNGFVATAGAEAGFVQQFGALTIIPSVRATYFHTQIDGYNEASDLLAMSFAQRQINQVLLGGKVRAVTPVKGFGMASTAFGEIGYEGFVSTSGGDVTSTLVGNTALPTTVKPGDPNGPGIIGKVGVSSQVTEGTFLDFQYGLSLHDGGGESHSGDIRLKSTF